MHTCFRHALARRCVRPFSVTGCLFNLYKTLGVDKGASPEQIREAYKKKAKLLHPDVNKSKDAHKEFAKLGEAHEILSDADKRRNYDLTGMANPQEAQQAAQAAAQQAAFRNAFGGAFGGAARAYEPPRKPSPVKPKPTRGRDVTAKVVLGLQEILSDKVKQVHYDILATCEPCGGTGSKDKAPLVDCPACDGDGFLPVRNGPFVVQWERCGECDGTGKRVRVFCPHCRGKGMATREVSVEVAIPQGVESGEKFKVPKHGSDGPVRGPKGDLVLEAVVEDHEWFVRRGLDVHVVMPVPLGLAIGGGPYKVLTLSGEAKVEIPPGTQYGDTLRLEGKGLRRKEQAGDHYVHLAVAIPDGLDAEALAKLQELLPPTYPTPDQLRSLKAKFEPLMK